MPIGPAQTNSHPSRKIEDRAECSLYRIVSGPEQWVQLDEGARKTVVLGYHI
jgi:hypothetical protein